MIADPTVFEPEAAGLTEEEWNHLDAWLLGFEEDWRPGGFADRVRELARLGDRLRRPALMEMVKIDLERQWRSGRPAIVEQYLKALPELGTPETVAPDLIAEEYKVRQRIGGRAVPGEFAKRFPWQIGAVMRLLEQGGDGAAPGSGDQPSGPSATPPPLAETLAWGVPRVLGPYEILRPLGHGAMGSVFLARDRSLGRLVALKVPRFGSDEDSEVLERFLREGQAAANCDCDNLCRVYAAQVVDGMHALVMEYVGGDSLADLLSQGQEFEQRWIAGTVRQLALAMDAVHRQGVIHRDLKPANVVVHPRRGPVVVDFGLARRFGSEEARLTRDGAMVGTPAYMAPEQLRSASAEPDHRCDIYSLGVILYELLTGRTPFQGTLSTVLAGILNEEPPPPSLHRLDLDPELQSICLIAMAKDPSHRYPTMGALAEALESYLDRAEGPSAQVLPVSSALSDAPRPVVKPGEEPRRLAGGRWIAAGIAFVAAFVALGVVIYLVTDRGTLRIEGTDPQMVVRIDGEAVRVEAQGESPDDPVTLELRTGKHGLSVTRGVETLKVPRSFSIRRGEVTIVRVEYEPKADVGAKHEPRAEREITNSIGMKLRRIEPGTFLMGSPDSNEYALAEEKPQHSVRITRPFYLATTEVTVGQFTAFVEETGFTTEAERGGPEVWGWDEAAGAVKRQWSGLYHWRNPGFAQTREYPVGNVTYRDALAFLEWLSNKEKARYRLPTEAEWEYACRAGTTSRFVNGDDAERLPEVGNVRDATTFEKTRVEWPIQARDGYGFAAPVGRFRPNAWGLYDMHGNAWEWCADWYSGEYYGHSPADDPTGPNPTGLRTVRGGSWWSAPRRAQSAARDGFSETRIDWSIGFRVARDE